jgi:ATP-dependent RNA helicase DOB1
MLLNLLRVEGFDPEYLLKRSFHQYQNQKQIPEQEKSDTYPRNASDPF